MKGSKAAWLKKYMAPLKGATITKVEVKSEDSEWSGHEDWPILHITTKAGEKMILEISRDEEGNGPGFIFGLPNPLEKLK